MRGRSLEAAYDDLTHLASQICETPIALISLVDRDRQWFKSHHGLAAGETPRSLAFCAHAIHTEAPLVVPDAEADERFRDNPLVTGAPHVKSYAGVPLDAGDGLNVGTLCVIDNRARQLKDSQIKALRTIGNQVVSQFQLRTRVRELGQLGRAKDESSRLPLEPTGTRFFVELPKGHPG